MILAGGLAKRYGGPKPLAPIGLHGEAVIDLTASDARAAGFGAIVLVLGPRSASAVTYHVRRCWPSSVPVELAFQEVPLGTAHAVLCAREFVPEGPFGVVNADDVYGVPALRLLARWLSGDREYPETRGGSGSDTRTGYPHTGDTDKGDTDKGDTDKGDTGHVLVSFALRDTIVTGEPVTRGTCVVGPDGNLLAIVERRKVTMHPDGLFTSDDGLEPHELQGDTPVSVNLWGFTPAIWPVLEESVVAIHPGVSPDGSLRDERDVKPEVEVLLPEVIGHLVDGLAPGGPPAQSVRVLDGPGRCLGVTHADDLPVVRNELATMVGQGLRPEWIWESELSGENPKPSG